MILTKIEHVLHKIKIKESQNIPPVQNLTLGDNEVKDIPVKLPKLDIGKFNGNILNWQGLWDQFNSPLHIKTSITDIDKLKYFLCDSVLCLVSGLSLSSSNCNHAVQLLQERYGNTQVSINAYMKKIATIPPVKNDTDVRGLRKIYYELKTSVRNLRTLNVDTSAYGTFISRFTIKTFTEFRKWSIDFRHVRNVKTRSWG